VAQICIEVKII